MKDSPPSKYIRLIDDDNNNFIVRTKPFYSIFYETEPKKDDNLLAKFLKTVRTRGDAFWNKKKTMRCDQIISKNKPSSINVIDDIPFDMTGSEVAKKNMCLLIMVFLATILMGVIAFVYWVSAMGGSDNPDASFNPVLENRAIYVSIFFIAAAALLSVMLYELFTLKQVFRELFIGTKPGEVHSFLLGGGRRLVIWAFLLVWVGIVIYMTAVLARRPEEFREQIVVNLMIGMVLIVSQFFYYRAQSPAIKTFSLLVSVFVLGLIVSIVYAS